MQGRVLIDSQAYSCVWLRPTARRRPCVYVASLRWRAPTRRPPSGRTVDDFTLNDYLGAKRSLAEWKDAKAVVVVFLGTECPLAKLYGAKLAELDKKYGGQGVQFVGINSNQQDTLQEIAGLRPPARHRVSGLERRRREGR